MFELTPIVMNNRLKREGLPEASRQIFYLLRKGDTTKKWTYPAKMTINEDYKKEGASAYLYSESGYSIVRKWAIDNEKRKGK